MHTVAKGRQNIRKELSSVEDKTKHCHSLNMSCSEALSYCTEIKSGHTKVELPAFHGFQNFEAFTHFKDFFLNEHNLFNI
jgi:hypothetical protein